MQTHLSQAAPLTQTGQFTYQAEQKMQCLSMTLFLAVLDENPSHAICEIYQRCKSFCHPKCRRRWRGLDIVDEGR